MLYFCFSKKYLSFLSETYRTRSTCSRTDANCNECRDKVLAKSQAVLAEDLKKRSAYWTKDTDGDERRDVVSTEPQDEGHGTTKYPKKCKSFRVTAEDIKKLSQIDRVEEKAARLCMIVDPEGTQVAGEKLVDMPLGDIQLSPHINAKVYEEDFVNRRSFSEWCFNGRIPKKYHPLVAAVLSAVYDEYFCESERIDLVTGNGLSMLPFVLEEQILCLRSILAVCLDDMHSVLQDLRCFAHTWLKAGVSQFFVPGNSIQVYLDVCFFRCLFNIIAGLLDAAYRTKASNPMDCLTTCCHCGKSLLRDGVDALQRRLCSECRGVAYCSMNCAKEDWPLHKIFCKKIRKATARRNKTEYSLHRSSKDEIEYVRTRAFRNNDVHYKRGRLLSLLNGMESYFPKLVKLETFAILYLSLDEIDKVMIMPLNW